jgi:hypothetical protein
MMKPQAVPLEKRKPRQLISGKVNQKSSVGMISVEGVGLIPIPSYLLKKVKVGSTYNFNLEYSPLLNCIAIMGVKRVGRIKSIYDLAVDLIRTRNIPLLN